MPDEEMELCDWVPANDQLEGCLRLSNHTGHHVVGQAIHQQPGEAGSGSFTLWDVLDDGLLRPIIKADTEGKFTKQEMAAILAALDIKAGRLSI